MSENELTKKASNKMQEKKNSLSIKAKGIVDKLDSFLKEIEKYIDVPEDLGEYENIKIIIDELHQIKNEFTNDMFFIAAIGGIKSGKSTLINLLSHKEVSITRTGVETTLRPLIVTAGDITKISVYKKIGHISGDGYEISKDNFNTCINRIKGFRNFNFDHKSIEIEEVEFTPFNIENLLTKDNCKDKDKIIIVHIEIEKEELKSKYEYSLLSENVAFVDTPGLDGITATISGDRKNTNDWLIERVDLTLLLQSTVSPLSNSTVQCIKNLRDKLSEPKFHLIHNKFELKPWLKEIREPGYKEKIDDDSIAQTIKKLKDTLGINGLECYDIDFAKADDAFKSVFNNEKKDSGLLKESEFDQFEKDIYEHIIKTKDPIHEAHAITGLNSFIKRNISINNSDDLTINSITNTLNVERDRIKNFKNDITVQWDSLIDMFNWDTHEKRIVGELEEPFDAESGQKVDDGYSFSEAIKEINTFYTENINDYNMTKANITNDVITLSNQMRSKIKNKLTSSTTMKNYILSRELTCGNSIDKVIKNLEVESKYKFDSESLYDDLENIDIGYEELMPGYIRKSLIDIRIFGKNIAVIKQEIMNALKKKAQNEINSFKIKLINRINESFSLYAKALKEEKVKKLQDLDERLKKDISCLENAESCINKIKEFTIEFKL